VRGTNPAAIPHGRTAGRLVVATGATAGAAVLGFFGARHLLRQARIGPDPERGQHLDHPPGLEHRIRSFDGTELAVNVVGPRDAPAVVLIHGFSGDMTLWYFQWKALSERWRVVLYDQRGHGRSGAAAGGDYSLEALGRDLQAVLDAEAPSGPVALIGHSLGGMTILSFASAFPHQFGERVQAVVLANTAAADVVMAAMSGLGLRAARLVASSALRFTSNRERVYRVRARALGGRGDVAFLAAKLTNFGPEAAPSLVEHVAKVGARAPVEVWSDLLVSLIEMDLRHALEHVRVPALIVVGDVDRLTPPASALAMKRALPDARMVVFKGAGHQAMLERHEPFNRLVDRFLAEQLSAQRQEAPA
jgi:pimeloyl-ACP methyl ester carboxylesterase